MSFNLKYLPIKTCFGIVCVFSVSIGDLRSQETTPQDEWADFFGTEKTTVSRVHRDRIEAAWTQLLVAGNRARRDARSELVQLGAPAAQRLLKELKSESREAKRQAILTLGRLPQDQVVEALEQRLLRGPEQSDESMLRRFAWALGRIGRAEHGDLMLQRLQKAKRRETSRYLLYALARVGRADQCDRIARFWDREKNRQSRAALLIALGRLGGAGGDRVIREGLNSRKSDLHRVAALAYADRRGPFDPKLCARLLSDRSEQVQALALIGLALVEDTKIAPFLLDRHLLQHRSASIRSLTALALAAQGGERALKALVKRMDRQKERDPKVRATLALSLGRFRDTAAHAPLLASLKTGDPSESAAALLALLMRGRGGADLKKIVETRRPELASLALRALVWSRATKGLALAKRLADDPKTGSQLRKLAQEIRTFEREGQPALRSRLRARLQLSVDDLGGSAEWELLRVLHREMLHIENLDRALDGRVSGRVSAGGQQRPPDRMSKEEEDLRLWLDRYPYFDRRQSYEIKR